MFIEFDVSKMAYLSLNKIVYFPVFCNLALFAANTGFFSTAAGQKITEKMSESLFACDFEVFGRVQGVFFRKYTEKQAVALGLRGWCMNTSGGTVKGQLEGSEKKLNEMKNWLQFTGSPSSKIDKAVFSEMKPITDYTFQAFTIKR